MFGSINNDYVDGRIFLEYIVNRSTLPFTFSNDYEFVEIRTLRRVE
ncbi:MAG: hypothetical protein FWC78_04465 [Defluviitaleaceae bacterium]|nr:hypothetical protein [Defluviitaleaceae bacterium]